MHPNNGNRGGGNNNFNRRPRNNNQAGGGNRGGGNTGGNTFNRRPQQQTNLRNQIFDSHGPNGERVRGNAFQVHEKYQSLARDAEERVDQEAYQQHAEHYYRIVEAIQDMETEQRARFAPQAQPGQQGGQPQQQGYQAPPADPFAAPYTAGFDGEQPELSAGNAGTEGEQGQRPPRREFNREPREQRQPRRDQQQEQQSGDQGERQEGERPRRFQNRGPVRMEDALVPPDGDERNESGGRGPIFSLTDKVDLDANTMDAPDGAAEDTPPETVAPRRRGRPAKPAATDDE